MLTITAIKQVSVKNPRHLKRLESYLDWEREKALDHDTQNLIAEDCKGIFREIDATRETYGHNRPGRAGAKCTYMQHQILAFSPDDCDVNGGKMTPELCMRYAREYVAARYPDCEALLVLHREHCKSDGTDRYACHIGLNRTLLDGSGRRLDEGPARKAAQARVKTVRELDERYGLRQLERGRNDRSHARQPSKAEREWQRRDRTHRSENDLVRERVAVRACEVAALPERPNRPRELARRLKEDGITMTRSKTGDLQYRFESESLKRNGKGRVRRINGATLGRVVSRAGRAVGLDVGGVRLALGLARQLGRAVERSMEDDGRER